MALMSERERTEKAIKLLRAATGYVRKGWTREANARKTSGWVCDPESVVASCWCAQGAMLASMPDIGLRHPYLDTTRTYTEAEADHIIETRVDVLTATKNAMYAVADIPSALAGHKSGIPLWNDEIVEDGEEVAATMEVVADKLEATL